MKKLLVITALCVALAACGARVNLKPKEGNTLPVKPETAVSVPTPTQLMEPTTQARPKRSDEQLKRSEERREDKFDLPPA